MMTPSTRSPAIIGTPSQQRAAMPMRAMPMRRQNSLVSPRISSGWRVLQHIGHQPALLRQRFDAAGGTPRPQS